jgi:UDP-glucuronate 4-epimerase
MNAASPQTDSILVTGAAGFIGYHVARRLLEVGRTVVGLDNLNAYYDPALKQARLNELARFSAFHFERCELADRDRMAALFAAHRFPHVVHLAAQAGVRYSLVDPHAYVDANLAGFLNVLEGCRQCRQLENRLSCAAGGRRRWETQDRGPCWVCTWNRVYQASVWCSEIRCQAAPGLNPGTLSETTL